MSKKDESPVSDAEDALLPVPVVKVRVLTDCVFGKCNDVAEILAEELESAKVGGLVDDDADAIAYAESLQASA